MLKEQQGMHLDFDRKHPPAPKKPAYTMPDGQQMVAFGDSVKLASSKGLQSVFPGITVDAETSRSMTKALGLIDQAKSQPEGLRQWVLVGLATNSAVTDGQLNDILNDIGPDHVLVLINAHAPVSWVPGTNDALSNFAAAHSDNVVLVDWDATISAHPDELAGDVQYAVRPGCQGCDCELDQARALKHPSCESRQSSFAMNMRNPPDSFEQGDSS